MAVYSDDVQKIYIAYYGRPADAVGLAFWESQLEATSGNLVDKFISRLYRFFERHQNKQT
jgi:hypothetical protein